MLFLATPVFDHFLHAHPIVFRNISLNLLILPDLRLQVVTLVIGFLWALACMGSTCSFKSGSGKHVSHVTVAHSLLHLLNVAASLHKISIKRTDRFLVHFYNL